MWGSRGVNQDFKWGRWQILENSPLTKREGRKKWEPFSEEGSHQRDMMGSAVVTLGPIMLRWWEPSSLKGSHFFLPSLFVRGLFSKICHWPHFLYLMALPNSILTYLGEGQRKNLILFRHWVAMIWLHNKSIYMSYILSLVHNCLDFRGPCS